MIYFVQDCETLHIKIGYVWPPPIDQPDSLKRAKARLYKLQIGNPSKLKLVLVMPSEEEDERLFHEKFAGDRVRGEWFRPSPGLLFEMLTEAHRQGWVAGRREGCMFVCNRERAAATILQAATPGANHES